MKGIYLLCEKAEGKGETPPKVVIVRLYSFLMKYSGWGVAAGKKDGFSGSSWKVVGRSGDSYLGAPRAVVHDYYSSCWKLTSNSPLALSPGCCRGEGEISVGFGSEFSLESGLEEDPSQVIDLPRAFRGGDSKERVSSISRDGSRAYFPNWDLTLEERTHLARAVIPYAAVLQSRLILHASAVASHEGCSAFVGASGAGKSTLARMLGKRRHSIVADDLLPVRRPSSQGSTVHCSGTCRPFPRRVFFLERSSIVLEPTCRPLTKKEFFVCLRRHGFGDLQSETVWKRQFEQYAWMTERSEGLALDLPEGLTRLADSLGRLEEILLG